MSISSKPKNTQKALELIHSGAGRDHLGGNNKTAVHAAAWTENQAVFDALIEHGFPIDAVDRNGDTPLHYAAYKGFDYAVEKLIAQGVDINAKDSVNVTPLIYACNQQHTEAQVILARSGADITHVQKDYPKHYRELLPIADAARLKKNTALSRNRERTTALGI